MERAGVPVQTPADSDNGLTQELEEKIVDACANVLNAFARWIDSKAKER